MSRSNWEIRQLDQKHTRTASDPLPPGGHATRQSIEDTFIELAWRSHLQVRCDHAWADKATKQYVYAIIYGGVFGAETTPCQ